MRRTMAEILIRLVSRRWMPSDRRLDSSLQDLRITKHTELGNNDSIKSPPMEIASRRMSKREKNAPTQHKYSSTILYLTLFSTSR